MNVSVVIRTKDEADRLRLTLASLARQSRPAEVVVVDDGSSDHTQAVLKEAAAALPLTVVRHAAPRRRSAASNAGAKAASGDLLVFLDGDTLAHPEMVAQHAAAQASGPVRIGRGGRFHLRGTRFLADPERGTPRPGEEARIARMTSEERMRLVVTREQISGDFDAIAARAEPGIYPGAGPRKLEELELDALRHHPHLGVLWEATCGANLGIPRDVFLDAGGFDETIDQNEHRELALRLCKDGAKLVLVEAARAYHMTHRIGWRDPLLDPEWERRFFALHPCLAVKLLAVFWASLAANSRIPRETQILSLPELDRASRGEDGIDYDAVRRMASLPDLSEVPA
jgi:glycosyltransferase involved in cell wall biosynthesis